MIMGFTVGSIIAVELAGGNEQWTGVPSTLVMLGAAGVAYPIGWLIDRVGYRWGLSAGYLIGLGSMIVAGVAVINQSLFLFLGGVFGLGLARGTVILGRYAAGDASPPNRRAQAISWVVLGGTVGSVGGPALIELATRLATHLNLPPFSGPWLLGSLCFAASLVIAHIFLRPDPQTLARHWSPIQPNLSPADRRGRDFRLILRNPLARLAVSAMIFGQLAMVLVMVVTPVYMHNHPYEISAISFVIMAHTLGMFGLSFMTGWLIERWNEPLVIGLGCLILAVACLTAPLSDNVYWLAGALFLLGLGWNFCFVAGSSLLSASLQPQEKGRVQGLVDSLVNLASGSGTLGGGVLFAAVGFGVMSWLTILVTLPPVLQSFRLREPAEPIEPVTPERLSP